jgi:hypothetical protein
MLRDMWQGFLGQEFFKQVGHSGGWAMMALMQLASPTRGLCPFASFARTNGATAASPHRRAAAVVSAAWPEFSVQFLQNRGSTDIFAADASLGTNKIGVCGRRAQHAKA